MTDRKQSEAERLFHAAVSLPPRERSAFLRANCSDAVLRDEVEKLLAYHEKAREEEERLPPSLSAGHTVDVERYARDLDEHGASESAAPSGTSAEPPPGAVISGHYHVERLLGRGGMGAVYLARDAKLERPVALKFLGLELARDAEQRRRFLAEARAASALNHPNVCVIYEVGETDDGHPFLAMECIEGEGLDTLIRARKTSVRDILSITTQLVAALDAAHARGIVHREIKPANIRMSTDRRVKVLDFGLAKRTDTDSGFRVESASGDAHTLPGMILGTPAYMSPEQALGGDIDTRSDLFSVGTVLYEMLAGRTPFAGSSMPEVLQKVVSGHPEAPSSLRPGGEAIPAELERITLKCLEKDPARRYQSARELLIELRRIRRELFQDAADTEEVLAAEITALDPRAVDLEVLAPRTEEVRESDVFISYASIDDRPVSAGREGWISQFHKNLELRVAQLSGEAVRVWRQPDPGGRAELE